MSKLEEKTKEVFDETENGIILVEMEEGKLLLLVKGEDIRLENMLRQAFDLKPEFFDLTEVAVDAYKDLQEFKKLSASDSLEKIKKALKGFLDELDK